ncbi:MarR family winged helix-turn-helix transcriptional regulator [Allorhizobium undicola]|uniref:MarR family winged helix-turn-helix transcriptional regulator n=1 Tax=Allorhizobium undicola TaxID=78527 RepID=UPI000686A920|nr:MarR family winged helix-turn-helix transcriptional regulator [Allorhizobium undicola]
MWDGVLKSGDTGPFGFRLSSLARLWRRRVEEHLAAAGFTDASWRPLVYLYHHGDGVTQKELAGIVGLDGSTLVRLLDILEKQSLIERRNDVQDRRVNRIFLTEQGFAAINDIRARVEPLETALLADVPPDELKAVLRMFDDLEKKLSPDASG